jgi:hypothetical protein
MPNCRIRKKRSVKSKESKMSTIRNKHDTKESGSVPHHYEAKTKQKIQPNPVLNWRTKLAYQVWSMKCNKFLQHHVVIKSGPV